MAQFTINGEKVGGLPTELAQPATFSPDVEAALLEYVQKNIDDDRFLKFVDGDDIAKRGDAEPDDLSLSPAARRYARIAAKRNAPAREVVQRVEIDGDEWYVAAFDLTRVARLELLSSRDSMGRLDLSDGNKIRSWLIALLVCGVVQGPDDLRPMFTLKPGDGDGEMSSAAEWVDSSDAAVRAIAQRLQQEVVLHNVDYFDPTGAAMAELEKKVNPEPSSTPSPTMLADGSEPTTSTDTPQESATGSTVATAPDDTTTATLG